MVEARETGAEAPVWRIDTASGPVEAQSVAAVMFGVDQAVRAGHLNAFEPIPTGLQMLDHRMGGGLRLGELLLLGGVQGVGKTNMALQMV
jgi:replicative DNA helicase